MPTKKTRLAVTLTPESRAALERLHEASGIAASQFVAQVVHDSVPVFDAMATAFVAAKKSPARAAEVMRELLGKAHMDVAQYQLALDEAIARRPRRKLRRRPVK